jgi:hypothetical protein
LKKFAYFSATTDKYFDAAAPVLSPARIFRLPLPYSRQKESSGFVT